MFWSLCLWCSVLCGPCPSVWACFVSGSHEPVRLAHSIPSPGACHYRSIVPLAALALPPFEHESWRMSDPFSQCSPHTGGGARTCTTGTQGGCAPRRHAPLVSRVRGDLRTGAWPCCQGRIALWVAQLQVAKPANTDSASSAPCTCDILPRQVPPSSCMCL